MKVSPLIILFVFLFFLLLERLFPLRKEQVNWTARIKDNLMLAVLAIPFTRILAYPLVAKVIVYSEARNLGLLHQFFLATPVLAILSFLILDYLLYWWHRLNHRVSFLWRFHQVHHADPEMDASTALRFHFGELLLSAGIRAGLVLLFGFSMKVLIAFDLTVTCLALFHHSNLKLPLWMEKGLRPVIVTPAFHQNHHSYFQKETDSNFSTIFSVWDFLHGTHTKELSPTDVTIGLPYIGKVRPGLMNLVVMPVKKLSAWPKKFTSRNP